MLDVLIQLLVFLIVVGLVYWVLTIIPLPSPIRQIATVIIVVLAAFYLISLLLDLGGAGPHLFYRH